jgi:hypothetical protein
MHQNSNEKENALDFIIPHDGESENLKNGRNSLNV